LSSRVITVVKPWILCMVSSQELDRISPTPGQGLLMKLFPYKSQDGFSLIEVLIALVILAMVILGGGLYFFYGRLGINREGYRRAALELASQRLEELKAAKWNDIAPQSGEISDGYTFNPSIRYYLLGSSSWNWIQPEDLENDPPGDAIENLPVGNPSGEENGMMVTRAKAQEVENSSYELLKVTVTVKWNIAEWDHNTSNKVDLITLITP